MDQTHSLTSLPGYDPDRLLDLIANESVTFVARRDYGFGALFDLEPSDRARYERPDDARDSITDLEIIVRR